MIQEYREEHLNQAGQPLPHYVCTGGCKFYSPQPGVCPTANCPRVRNPLTRCECEDGDHHDLINRNATRVGR